jgi:hypothetical protein
MVGNPTVYDRIAGNVRMSCISIRKLGGCYNGAGENSSHYHSQVRMRSIFIRILDWGMVTDIFPANVSGSYIHVGGIGTCQTTQ